MGVWGHLEEDDLRLEGPFLCLADKAGRKLGVGPWPHGLGYPLGGPTQRRVWSDLQESFLLARRPPWDKGNSTGRTAPGLSPRGDVELSRMDGLQVGGQGLLGVLRRGRACRLGIAGCVGVGRSEHLLKPSCLG